MTVKTRLRVGLIGAGGISAAHLPHLLRLAEEVQVHALDGAEALVAAHGGTLAPSLDALLASVDVVDIVTPTPTHAAIAARAFDAGVHVISEKPLSRHAAEGAALVALAEAAGRQLHVAHVVRWFPEYVRLKEAAVAGALGRIAVQRFFRSGAYPVRTPWFADHRASGGIVLDQMIHDLDVARWIAGEVVRVSAVRSAAHGAGGPVETAHVLLTHEAGAISHVAGVWGAQHLRFTTGYHVAGTGGTLQHDSALEQDVRTDLAASTLGGEAMPAVDPAEDPYFLELSEFLAAIDGGPAPRVTAADAVAAVTIGEAALESIDLGRPVELAAASEAAA